MKPLKNKIVQARMSEDELMDFEAVKNVLHAKTNSEAIRLMVKDEQTIETAAKRQNGEKKKLHWKILRFCCMKTGWQ